jgi:hypothetical protein
MPTLDINGKRVTVDGSFLSLSPEQQNATVDEIAASFDAAPSAVETGMAELSGLTQAAGQASQHDVDTNVRAEMEASKLQQIMPKGTWRDFNDSAMGSIPFQDEIFSATLGNVGRMVRDQVGPVEAYQREMALQEALRAQREKRSPVASTAGNIAGSIGTGLAAAGGGLTMAGKALPVIGKTGAAALEGGLYGGLYGAGEGRGAERLGNAARGATIGAVTAGALSKGGDMIAGRMARKAVPAAPAASALKDEASTLFDQAYKSGTMVTKPAQTRLAQNMQMVADRLNPQLRPQTAGILDDVMAKAKSGGYADVQAVHELRRQIGDAMDGAVPDDVRTLGKMKRVVDAFLDSPPKGAITGSQQGFNTLRQAIDVSAKQHKTALIEKTLDLSDVTANGTYTQSGLQNALKTKFSALYKQILDKKVSGFTAEEISMIRSLASKQTSPKALNWLAKWTPKGPMATTLAAIFGGGGGALVGGPAGAALGTGAIMAPGWLAGRAVDKSAMSVANALRDSAARGGAAVLPKVANPMLPYSLPGALTATELQRQYQR